MQFTTLILSALLGLVSAQTMVTTVEVSTKNNSLVFQPDNIKAPAGSMVQFQFLAGNHTVTQSTFDQPCQPINSINSSIVGFHSGYVPAAASVAQGMIPTYTIMINNTNPLWVYCAQGKHCQAGMVMVINENTNANASRSLSGYKAAAAKVSSAGTPTGGAAAGTTGSTTSPSGSTTSAVTAAGTVDVVPKAFVGLAALAGSLLLL